MDFNNFFTIYVSEIKESMADIPTELPCLGDIKNPGQLPVQEVLRGTDDFVLWILTISSLFMFSGSRNSFLTFLPSYYEKSSKIYKIESSVPLEPEVDLKCRG